MHLIRSLTAILAGLCLLALPAAAQAPDALPFVLKQVGPSVYAAIGGPKAGSNAGFVIGDDGVLVIDSFFYLDAAKALLGEIRKITDKPIRYVVNTHHHIDHVSGDRVFRDAGAAIIAHRNVSGWIHSENLHLFGDRITPELKAQIEALPTPDLTLDKTTMLTLGKRRIEVKPVEGHTGGDLIVTVPDAGVVFAGDILWNHTGPTTIDGTIGKWIAALAQLEASPNTVFVPGHGDVATIKDVDDLKALFADLTAVTADVRRSGLSGDAVVAAAAPKLIALHRDWPRIEQSAPRLVGEMDQELAGTKRVPVPAAKAR